MRPGEPTPVHSRWRWRRLGGLASAILAISFLWGWPARRNYYFKRDRVRQRLDVPYVAGAADPKQQLDLYLPPGDRTGFPIVVFVHGGYWSPLDRRWLQPLLGAFGNVGVAFANHGIAAAIIGYRRYRRFNGATTHSKTSRPRSAFNTTRAGRGCGPLFVIGHSAGGHLVSLLAMDPRILERSGVDAAVIAGFVSIDGIFDLGASLAAFEPNQVDIMRQLFGPDDAALAAHSTISYARAEHSRLLFVDSTDDAKVCRDGFYQMKARMAAVNSPAKFVELSGLGHNETIIRIGMDDDPVMPSLLAFIRER
jgi:hypothetical protein